MRLTTLHMVVAALATAPLLSAAAQPAHPAAVASSPIMRVAQDCPAGYHWEESGYVAEGKYRAAHCAKNGGRE
jgi:hypothetical protein